MLFHVSNRILMRYGLNAHEMHMLSHGVTNIIS